MREFQTPFGSEPWSVWNNELIQNLQISLTRTGLAMVFIILIGVPVGYAMGRWWRVQAFFTDIVTVGIALPAYMWALLTVMWFGFGIRAPGLLRRGVGDARPDRPRPAGHARDPPRAPGHVGCVRRPGADPSQGPRAPLDGGRPDRRRPPVDHRGVGLRRARRVVREQRGRRLPRPRLVSIGGGLQRTDGLGRRGAGRRDRDRPRDHRAYRPEGPRLARVDRLVRSEGGADGEIGEERPTWRS